jgi:hypothetical protein
VCAHIVAPSLGVNADGMLLPAGHWSASVSFRYYNSRQDVLGDEPQDQPIVYANTHIYGLDLNATYAVTNRLNAVLDIPFQYGTRATSIEHDFTRPNPPPLHTMEAGGLGDIRLRADFWLLDPAKHPNQNIAVGLGVKFPSGDSGATDTSFRPTGPVERPVDPAIQPGDGGWGIILHGHGFARFSSAGWFKNTFAYVDGTYLSNPRETNDTENTLGDVTVSFPPTSDPRLKFNSVPDQFLARIGFTQVGFPVKELSFSFGGRLEGVPSHDLIGGNEGWRLPGYAVSVEPGVSYSRGKDYIALTVPIAVFRHASKAVPFEQVGVPGPGLATIADYQIILTYTRQF